jgi:U1 small nuclear ribonucleoprotein
VGKDADRIRKKDVDGVASLLARLKEEITQDLIDAGQNATADGMEEGEEPVYTHAEETKRQMHREERKRKKAEDFQTAKDTCMWPMLLCANEFVTDPTTRHF